MHYCSLSSVISIYILQDSEYKPITFIAVIVAKKFCPFTVLHSIYLGNN